MNNTFLKNLRALINSLWWRRAVRYTVRALWIALAVIVLALIARRWLNFNLFTMNWTGWLGIAAGVALLSWLPGVRPRPALHTFSARLDRRLALRERMTTAVEVAGAARPPEYVEGLLLSDAGHTLAAVQTQVGRTSAIPWRDLQIVLLLALALAGLWLLNISPLTLPGTGKLNLPSPWQEPNPKFNEPNPRLGQPLNPPQAGGAGQGQGQNAPGSISADAARKALQAIANALRDQAVTRDAANALDRGDVKGAASALRSLADQADQLSDRNRKDLAGAMGKAAQGVDQALGVASGDKTADALRGAGRALSSNEAQAASKALEDLARAIEALGEKANATPPPSPQGDPKAQGGQGNDAGQNPGNQQPNGAQPKESGQPQSGNNQNGSNGQPQAGANPPNSSQGQPKDNQGQGKPSTQGNQGNDPGQQGAGGQGAGAGQGQGNDSSASGQRTSDPSERLGVEGVPVELKGDPNAESNGLLQPTQNTNGPVTGSQSGRSTFAPQGSPGKDKVNTGDEPLRFPWELRQAVQNYFGGK